MGEFAICRDEEVTLPCLIDCNPRTIAQVACISAEDQRIVLTRNRALLMHELISHGCHVRETRPRKQLEEIVSRLDLYRAIKLFSRCPCCNRALRPVAREIIRDRLPLASVPIAASGFATAARGLAPRARIGVGWSGSSAISCGKAREVVPLLTRRRKGCATRYAT
ncbi:MAG: Mut7-C RNAse domain-containing protein [Hyphomicrobiaceae bacterium]